MNYYDIYLKGFKDGQINENSNNYKDKVAGKIYSLGKTDGYLFKIDDLINIQTEESIKDWVKHYKTHL